MLVGSASDTPTAVFYDPTGRRRHLLLMLLIATVSVAVVALSLLIIGLTGGGHPPRTLLGRSPVTDGPSRARQGATGRSPAPYPSLSRPAILPGLPTLPVP
ncbi:MAG TPA: hypothetical protein VK586_08835 [Streptosporangiaceae bacterium]|nr:hypothetical protein [Streptosporangiaceae bacterium]